MKAARSLVTALALVLMMGAFSFPAAGQMPHPNVWEVYLAANGRDLAVRGAFAPGSVVLINGEAQKTRQLSTDPTILVVKKGVKKIRHLPTPEFAIQEPDGVVSSLFVPPRIDTIVTLEDNGAIVNLKVGDSVLVLLGDTVAWRMYSLSYDVAILGQAQGAGTAIIGYIGLFKTAGMGMGTLSITGDPACIWRAVPCSDPQTNFKVSFAVTE
jgi:hypothetical protein